MPEIAGGRGGGYHLGVPIVRVIVSLGVYIGVPLFGEAAIILYIYICIHNSSQRNKEVYRANALAVHFRPQFSNPKPSSGYITVKGIRKLLVLLADGPLSIIHAACSFSFLGGGVRAGYRVLALQGFAAKFKAVGC